MKYKLCGQAAGMQEKGITLLEMLVTIAVLSIIASVAMPSLSGLEVRKLDDTTREVVEAFRFAQSEAVRTGIPHGVQLDLGDTRLRVYRYLTLALYDVRHPVTKKLYQIDFQTEENPVAVVSRQFKFVSLSTNYQNYISYTPGTGIPRSGSIAPTRMLEYANFSLTLGNHSVQVSVDANSGRVSTQ